MADIAKTIEILFSGVDNVSSMTKTIGGNIESLGNSVSDIAAPFETATKAIITFEGALAAIAAGAFVYAFNASKNFENSVLELQKVLGDGEDMNLAEARAIELADAYGESATSILESMANFKQSGFDLAEAMGLSKTAMDLVIAGGLDASDASNLLTASLKGFGASAEDANRLVNILNETSNNYATDVKQLAEGMARISPIASQMGFSMEESAGLLTPIIEVFRSGDEAANALRTGLLQLTNDTKPVIETLGLLGVSQQDANGQFKSGKEIFYEVANAMKDMDANQRLFYTQQLVGIEQAPKMTLLFSDLGKVTDITATAMNSAGSAAKEVAIRLDSAEVSVNRFKVAFENLGKEVGEEFKDSAKEAINGATDIVKAFSSITDSGSFNDILTFVENFMGEIGDTLKNVAENIPEAFEGVEFDTLIDGLNNLKDSFGGMFDGIDLSSPEGLLELIQTIINALGGLQNTAAGIVQFLTPITDSIGLLIDKFSELSPATQETIGEIAAFGAALGGVATVLATGGALLAGIGALGIALTGPVGIVAGLSALTLGLGAAVTKLAEWHSDTLNKDIIETTARLDAQNTQIENLLDQLDKVSLNNSKRIEIEVAIENGEFEKAQILIDKAVSDDHIIQVNAVLEQEKFEKSYSEILKLGSLSENELKILANLENQDEIEEAVAKITKDRELNVKPSVDTKPATQEIQLWTESQGYITISVPVDAKGVDEAKKKVDDIPTEKQLEIKLKGEIDKDIEKIKANADTVQTAMEWTAKLDISKVEAATEVTKAAFDSIGESVSSVTAGVSDMFGSLISGLASGNLSYLEESNLWRYLEQEQKTQEELVAAQIELTETQTDYYNKQIEKLSSGDATIKIDSTGLEPSLELVMWQILQKIQVKANESASNFLLGIS